MKHIINIRIIFSLNRNRHEDLLFETVEEVIENFPNTSNIMRKNLLLIEEFADKDFHKGFVKARNFTPERPTFVQVTKHDLFEIKE